MKVWTALSTGGEESRWQALSEALTRAGAANSYVPWTDSTNEIHDLNVFSKFDHVRLTTRIGGQVLRHVKVQSSWVTLLGVVDGMTKVDGAWWPLCAVYQSLGEILIELGRGLDMRGNVLIAGAGGEARVALASFFKAGFRQFLVTNYEASEAEAMVKEMRGKFFGLEITHIPMDKIVLLPGETSVLVNTTPHIEENALLVELSYLNFLKRDGYLFDFHRSPKPTVLAQEALDAGVKVIGGQQIAAHSDVLWAKWAFGVDLPRPERLASASP